jgi:hypothetical protein
MAIGSTASAATAESNAMSQRYQNHYKIVRHSGAASSKIRPECLITASRGSRTIQRD